LTDENGGHESVEGGVRPRHLAGRSAWFGGLRITTVDEVLDDKLASALRRPIKYSRPHHVHRRAAIALAGRHDGLIRR
jgi:hypothetical protein